ncbi:LacI family transcriptional regulator [Ruminiclostridium sufflavum DSM 19573]|uniref:LacI family transcriptional regulator n=1 Tax=Ruminiclostridium sufflavum DSM 19573 TaxID=1121337 RepID=A0A318Y726_9FIRM|nr:LacI family DNA-binding transcriptional regulator [Ruminiclostridium sufflavum]PYG87941.1 LacI family transcriptional regulator [Ruminiclostridium sufflavum DSM 19573]
MSVTIKDIAAVAKVSRGTVDRVLNNRGGVNPDVEERVKMVVKALGYKPNSAAKALSILKKRMVFGVLLPSINNPFFKDLIAGIYAAQKEYEDYGVKVILKEMSGYDVENQIEFIDELLAEGVTALAFLPFDDRKIAEKINQIVASGIPVVTINSDIENSARNCYIGVDFVQSGRIAAGLMGLINSKAQILVLSGTGKLLSHNQRIRGFCEVMDSRLSNLSIIETLECNDNDFLAYDLVSKALAVHPQIDALYITGEGIKGACEAISKLNERKISTICYDDGPHIKQLVKEGKINATICQQPFKQGYESIAYLFKYFAGAELSEKSNILMDNIIEIVENIDYKSQ